MRFAVESWAPDYGQAVGEDVLTEATTPVDVSVERPAADWTPIAPPPHLRAARPQALFVDGVRRIDARVWISREDGTTAQGICASWAAGAVRCDGSAEICATTVDRGLFATGAGLAPIVSPHGRWEVRQVACDEDLSLALQQAMGRTEADVAVACRPGSTLGARPGREPPLTVIDGPLRENRRIPGAVGYVKTHQVAYLPAPLASTVTGLGPGERTPVFVAGQRFARFSWYVRLPGDASHPWSGVIRCESMTDRPATEAALLADKVTAALPRFSSERHKDPRAPQNLYPIGGLERELRRHLGDARLLERALRAAARSAVP